jgi:hypothetical protein
MIIIIIMCGLPNIYPVVLTIIFCFYFKITGIYFYCEELDYKILTNNILMSKLNYIHIMLYINKNGSDYR